MNITKPRFDHEKLIAYQRSLQFIVWCSPLMEKLPPKLAVADQLDRASTFHPIEYRGRQREIYRARSMPIFRHSPRLRIGVRSLPGCPGGKRQIYYGSSPRAEKNCCVKRYVCW